MTAASANWVAAGLLALGVFAAAAWGRAFAELVEAVWRRARRGRRRPSEPRPTPRRNTGLPPVSPALRGTGRARAARLDRDMGQRWNALVGAQPAQPAREWEPPPPAPDPDDDLRLAHTVGELLTGGASHEAVTHHHHDHGHGGSFGGGGASGDWGESTSSACDVDGGDCGGGGADD